MRGLAWEKKGSSSGGDAILSRGVGNGPADGGGEGRGGKLKAMVSMSSDLDARSKAKEDANRYLWGQDNKGSAMTNV